MTRTKTWLTMATAALALLVAGLAGGYWWAQGGTHRGTDQAAASATTTAERRVLYWYDPMVPDQHFERPGKSPFMDMQLVPKYADEVAGGGVRIDAGLQQSVGIRTAQVEVAPWISIVHAPGTLAWDLRQETVVSARAEGVVTRVQVKAPYTSVVRGQPLVSLRVPSWSSALAEAQALRQVQSPAARDLQSAAQHRLRVLGVPAGGVGRDGSVTLGAPSQGVVTEVLAREGQAVLPGTPLFRINGTATLWLEAAIPQAGVARLKPGTPVEASVSAVPGQTFVGEVEALLLQVDAANRTQRARIVVRNPDGVLAPGMFAEVTLRPQADVPLPWVPTEALIATGTDSRVIVQDADGSFRPVRVRTGRSGGGRTEVIAGLAGGERVVVSGQFLIDSEASLSGALERLGAPEAGPPGTPLEAPLPDNAPETAPVPAPAKIAAPASARSCPVQYWYDPMKPDQHFDQPGTSPFMDMQLVPKFAPGATPDCTVRDVPSASLEKQP